MPRADSMFRFARPLLLITLVLAIPIVPFVLAGDQFLSRFEAWFDPPPARSTLAALTVAVLASDVFLPVPSSVVGTVAGQQLGIVLGTAACWTGMSLGAVVAFALARAWGYPLAARLSSPDDLRRMESLTRRVGPMVLILARGLPVLAEASVLLVGVHRLSWRRFLPGVLLANLGIALAYAALGDLAAQMEWFPAALGVSLALPVLAGLAAQRGLRRWHDATTSQVGTSELDNVSKPV